MLLVVNVDWYFWSHRLTLARALRSSGYDVTIVAAEERGFRPRIEQEGFRFIPLRLWRGSVNPWREFLTWLDLVRIYRDERPDLLHHVSIKPVLYGSLAARLAGRPAVINAVTGLGYMFLPNVRQSLLGRLTAWLYRMASAGSRTMMLFQNPDDRAALVARRVVPERRTAVIKGSGVDVNAFRPSPVPDGPPIVLLCGRLLRDKGVFEFVEAARRLRDSNVPHRAVIVGVPDDQNPNAVPATMLRRWQQEGSVEWWGLREDMPEVFAQATVVTLPSYYPEGVPKVLLEAAASGRPIVATDVPGCREIARHGVNAELVPPRDSEALSAAIRTLLGDPDRRRRYAAAGREIAVTEFSEDRVVGETLALYKRLLADGRHARSINAA